MRDDRRRGPLDTGGTYFFFVVLACLRVVKLGLCLCRPSSFSRAWLRAIFAARNASYGFVGVLSSSFWPSILPHRSFLVEHGCSPIVLWIFSSGLGFSESCEKRIEDDKKNRSDFWKNKIWVRIIEFLCTYIHTYACGTWKRAKSSRASILLRMNDQSRKRKFLHVAGLPIPNERNTNETGFRRARLLVPRLKRISAWRENLFRPDPAGGQKRIRASTIFLENHAHQSSTSAWNRIVTQSKNVSSRKRKRRENYPPWASHSRKNTR